MSCWARKMTEHYCLVQIENFKKKNVKVYKSLYLKKIHTKQQ